MRPIAPNQERRLCVRDASAPPASDAPSDERNQAGRAFGLTPSSHDIAASSVKMRGLRAAPRSGWLMCPFEYELVDRLMKGHPL